MTSFCLVCYKEFPSNGNTFFEISPNQNASHVLHKFVRQLFGNVPTNEIDSVSIVSSCASCSNILDKYCDLQLQLKCVQMKIQWELRKLKILMHQAGRVPKRIDNFRENMLIKSGNQEEQVKTITNLRQRIYKTCSKKVKKLNPVVRLSLNSAIKLESRCKDEHNNDFEENTDLEDIAPTHDLESNKLNENIDIGAVEFVQQKLETSIDSDDDPIDHSQSDDNQNNAVIQNNFASDNQHTVEENDDSISRKRLRAVFKCKQCQRTFASKDNLTKHEQAEECKIIDDSDAESEIAANTSNERAKVYKPQKRQMDTTYSESDCPSNSSSMESASSSDAYMDEPDHQLKAADSQQMFTCPIKTCEQLFKQEIHLQLHLKLHGEFSCNFCDFKTELADKLWYHELSEHASKPKEPNKFQCSRCPKIFSTSKSSKTITEKHFFTKHLKIDYYNAVCPNCGRKLTVCRNSLQGTIKSHQRITSCITNDLEKRGDQIFRCSRENCKQVFRYREGLNIHLQLHGDFNCKFCEFQTNLADKLLEHEWFSHTINEKDSKKIKCSRCPTEFNNIPNRYQISVRYKHFFREHLHIKYEHLECSICGYKFASNSYSIKRGIERHMRIHNVEGRDPGEIFTCKICNAPFITDYGLRSHKFKVHKASRINCPFCSKTYKNARELTNHVKAVHKLEESDSVKYFRCPVTNCEQIFLHKFSLDGHMTRHKGKMLMCTECGKWAMDENALNSHMRKHINSKKMKKMFHVICELCGKRFHGNCKSFAERKLEIHLTSKIHSRSKTGELLSGWEYACELCGKLCNTLHKLEEHIRTHTKEQPFLCNVCGREFSIKWNLKRHMKLVHEKCNNGQEDTDDENV